MDRCPGTRRMTDAAELTGEVRYESDLSLRKTKLATIVTIANMFATSLLVFGALTLVNVLLTTQFGWTQTEYSWGMTAVLWCGASFMPLYGRPIDKIGVRPLIIFGIIGVGFCALAMGFMTGALWQFMRFLVCSACSAARRWAIRRSSARCPSIRRTAEWSMGGGDSENATCSAASEISALVAEQAFAALKGPIAHVTTPDIHMPYRRALEALHHPNKARIIHAVEALVGVGPAGT